MRTPSLQQLQALLAIVRLGSYHAAARELNLTQPSVSSRIKELEQLLDTQLLSRNGRTMQPTKDGVVAVRYAEQTLGLISEMQVVLRTGDPLQGPLRLGSNETIAVTCLSEIIAALERTFPDLRVELSISHSLALCRQLASNQLDIALVTETGYHHQDISHEPIACAEVAWLSNVALPLPDMLEPRDLIGAKILSFPDHSPLHDMIVSWCNTERSPTPKFNTCNNISVIAKLVASGVAAAVLPVCVLTDEVSNGTVRRHSQHEKFRPLKIFSTRPKIAATNRLDSVVQIARDVILKHRFFLPV